MTRNGDPSTTLNHGLGTVQSTPVTTDGTPDQACTFRPSPVPRNQANHAQTPARPQFHPGHRATKWPIFSLTGVPPIRLLRPARPDPAGRPYGALATAPFVATVRDRLRRGSFLACRAARVVAMRTRRIWFCGLANPRAFLATSLAVRLCASAFAFERTVECA